MALFPRPVRPNAALYAAWALFAVSFLLPAVWMPETLRVPAGYVAGAVCAGVAAVNVPDLFAMTSDSYMGLLTFANVLMATSLFWRRGARGRAWPAAAFAVAAALVAGTPAVFARSDELGRSLEFTWGYYVWLAAFVLAAAHFAVHLAARRRGPPRGVDHERAGGPGSRAAPAST